MQKNNPNNVVYRVFNFSCVDDITKMTTESDRTCFTPELFWEIRGWFVGAMQGKEESIQYVQNIFLFILFLFLFPCRMMLRCEIYTALTISAFIELT